MNWFDSNNCGESMHRFMRDDHLGIQAYHSDDTLCEGAEFDLAGMLHGDVEAFSPDEAKLQQAMRETDHLDAPALKGKGA